MDHFFQELGRTVSARWQAQNFAPSAFPQIARKALEENPPAENVDLSTLIRQFLLDDDQPFQTQSNFGQPELVVYDDPRLYIQVLFWLEGTTEIHQHSFSGAFHVLQGSSIHTEFSFTNAQPVSAHLQIGQLTAQSTQLLETGSTVEITSGRGHIHSLFHLDTPSLTVVVRTHNDPGTGPQFTYLPPHLAIDPFLDDALTARRKELLEVLERTDDPHYVELIQEMVENLDFERGFFVLQSAMAYLQNIGQWEEVWSAFQQKHGPLATYASATLEEIIWRDGPLGYRSASTDVEHRFFLALLLNVSQRKNILQLIAQRFPGSAIDHVMNWLDELSETSSASTWLLDAEFPLEVKVPKAKQPTLYRAALRVLLEGKAKPAKLGAIALSASDWRHLKASFQRSSLRALVS